MAVRHGPPASRVATGGGGSPWRGPRPESGEDPPRPLAAASGPAPEAGAGGRARRGRQGPGRVSAAGTRGGGAGARPPDLPATIDISGSSDKRQPHGGSIGIRAHACWELWWLSVQAAGWLLTFAVYIVQRRVAGCFSARDEIEGRQLQCRHFATGDVARLTSRCKVQAVLNAVYSRQHYPTSPGLPALPVSCCCC